MGQGVVKKCLFSNETRLGGAIHRCFSGDHDLEHVASFRLTLPIGTLDPFPLLSVTKKVNQSSQRMS